MHQSHKLHAYLLVHKEYIPKMIMNSEICEYTGCDKYTYPFMNYAHTQYMVP